MEATTFIYFSHSLGMPTELKKQYTDKLSSIFPNSEIIDIRIPQIIEQQLNELKLKGKQKETWLNQNYFFPLIDKSDIFIYTGGIESIKGSNSIGTKGELNYAISKNKNIQKITTEEITQLNNEYFKKLYEKGKKKTKTWVLKSINDYVKFYTTNKEAVNLIFSQFKEFENKSAKQAVIPHTSTLWSTNNHTKKFEFKKCFIHNINHAFINTSSQITENYCPYYNTSWLKPAYGKIKLNSIDDFNKTELITSSRVIHKSFWIFENEAFNFEGFCLKDKNNQIIRRKDGKPVEDLDKIIGVEPVFDIDIKAEIKESGANFFDIDIFNEYPVVIDSLKKYIEDELCGIDYRLGFSGNGIYFILQPLLFKEFDTDFISFSDRWKDWISNFQKLIEKKGIKNIRMELKYGWNRYFKVMGTFHASKERIAIPLNKDETLDYNWLNNITNIQSGLEENIFQEIIRNAGNSWRI